MDSASAAPLTRGLVRRTLTALRSQLITLSTGTPRPATDSAAIEPRSPTGVCEDALAAHNDTTSHKLRPGKQYPPRRAVFLEEAAMAREMFRL